MRKKREANTLNDDILAELLDFFHGVAHMYEDLNVPDLDAVCRPNISAVQLSKSMAVIQMGLLKQQLRQT